jgi:hypothetical protein
MITAQIVRVMIDRAGWRGAYLGLSIVVLVLAVPAVALCIWSLSSARNSPRG